MAPPPLRRILVVDDDDDLRAMTEHVLGSLGGFAVKGCVSGSAALAEGPGFAPQLALVDVMMPGLDGKATLLAMREDPVLSAVPVVFMTAESRPEEIARLRDTGAVGVLRKPFDPVSLPAAVSAIWAGLPAIGAVGPVTADAAKARLRDELAALGREFGEQLPARLDALAGTVASALATGDGACRNEARRQAHKLAGSAASFGYVDLGKHAAELEALLVAGAPLTPRRTERVLEATRALREAAGPEGGALETGAPGGPRRRSRS